MSKNEKGFDRREFLKGTAAGGGRDRRRHAGAVRPGPGAIRQDQGRPDAALHRHLCALGVAITNGFKLAVAERGGKLGGREIEYFVVDDESNPAKAPENANKLVQRDKVDVVIGTVHSGVAMGMAKVLKESGTLWINPNAGAGAVTGPLCAPNIFRTSFSNWQTTYALGKVLKAKGHKTAVFITWKYAAGEEMMQGFKEGFEKEGGKLVKELYRPSRRSSSRRC
jgi:branched-chain amino acid transport system substrate-binding protein